MRAVRGILVNHHNHPRLSMGLIPFISPSGRGDHASHPGLRVVPIRVSSRVCPNSQELARLELFKESCPRARPGLSVGLPPLGLAETAELVAD